MTEYFRIGFPISPKARAYGVVAFDEKGFGELTLANLLFIEHEQIQFLCMFHISSKPCYFLSISTVLWCSGLLQVKF